MFSSQCILWCGLKEDVCVKCYSLVCPNHCVVLCRSVWLRIDGDVLCKVTEFFVAACMVIA